jgi:chromosome segregation ATPase
MTSKEVEKLLLEMNHEIRTVIPARFNAIEGLMNNTFRELVQKGDGTIRTELDGLRVDMRSIGGKLGFTPKS